MVMKEKKYQELTPELLVWFIVTTWVIVLTNLIAML
jgi:hypothetical protein